MEDAGAIKARGRERHSGAIGCILAGGTWPQARLAAAGLVEDASCARCGEEAETVLHRWWRRPALGAVRRQAQVRELANIGAGRDYQPRCF